MIEEDTCIEEVVSQANTTEATVPATEEEQEEAKPKKKGLFSKLFSGLAKTRDNILGSVDDVLKNFKKIDEELYEELEEALIMADFGVDTTLAIMEDLRRIVKERKITEPSELKTAIQEIITNILTAHVTSPIIVENQPNVVLVIGVNGVGKTTTIGKLANQLQSDHKKVVLAAADTFRAAAIEQLQIWADRAHVDLIKQQEGSDPASVVYDGIKAAKSRKADVLICDTAGRLQNKTNLMKELEKIARIIDREYPEAHKEVLIVLDATTGQNAISQVKVFKEAAKVDGIILTKLDGTAKGGAIVGICQSLGVPVKYIGVGEKIDDLQVFDPQSFARALFNVE
ncbi:MAG: signal recognition particle-docking protein FtsY [Cellulosilyticaceae bacterium]